MHDHTSSQKNLKRSGKALPIPWLEPCGKPANTTSKPWWEGSLLSLMKLHSLSQHSASPSRFAISISRTETTAFNCYTFDYLLMHFLMLTSWYRGMILDKIHVIFPKVPTAPTSWVDSSMSRHTPKRLVVFSHGAEPKMSQKDFMIEIYITSNCVCKHTYVYIHGTCM